MRENAADTAGNVSLANMSWELLMANRRVNLSKNGFVARRKKCRRAPKDEWNCFFRAPLEHPSRGFKRRPTR
jgi:hypothetical protein